jgi:hypothetical protein
MSTVLYDRGTPVIVRTYGGRPAIRFLWETRRAGFVVTERPGDDTLAVGIPAGDVFAFDPLAEEAIACGHGLEWERLTQLRT